MAASTADTTARVPKAKSLRVSLSPLPEGRPLKRPRLSSTQDYDDYDCDCDDDDNGDFTLSSSLPSLQPELWAHIVDFLPYPSVLSSAAASASMLHEVMPLVTALHIDGASQLHAGVASRYREVKDIYIYSLVRGVVDSERDDDDTASVIDGELCIDDETAARAVPFLSNNFPRLERVFLGRRDPVSGEVRGFIPRQFESDDGVRMGNLIDAFSGAFRAGALPSNLWVLGLRCWRSAPNAFTGSSCPVCRNACRSFPLRQVADFECEGSSQKYLEHNYGNWGQYGHSFLYTEQLYGLDVCLSHEAIETIVRSRPGGHELLRSKERFLALLGRGTRHVIVTDDGRELYVVKYDSGEMGELVAFVRNSGDNMDVTTLPSDAVVGAIRRSFAEDCERGAIPPRERCYLARSSFYALKNDLGLRIDEGDFLNADEWNGKERTKGNREGCFSGYDWRFF